MKKYYRERFYAQQQLIKTIASFIEVNEILERAREKLRENIPFSMEVCILLLDPEADQYTRPLQCALYEKPTSCQSCKRNRPAVQKAIHRRKAVVERHSEPVERQNRESVMVGPEGAVPVFAGDEVLAVVSVVILPGRMFTRKDFFLMKDFAEVLGSVLLNAKKHWEMTREKIRISRMLTQLSPFVPQSVRTIVEKNPEQLDQVKEKKEVTVLFLDIEGYTELSARRGDSEVSAVIEQIFSSFVDPIHRSHGEINETAGDGLMIIFQGFDGRTNAVNSVKAAFEIHERSREIHAGLKPGVDPVHVNIGINSGSALVGMSRFTGSLGTRMTYTATGEVTNLAARLADHARGGDILLGGETKRLIQGLWTLHDLGTVKMKGIGKPVSLYSLLSPEPS
ncbi:MAG: adenylate/guanylate cyclase domain-containing protein [Desulfobacteraceae bacterium]